MEVKHFKRSRYNYREIKPAESEREKQRYKLTPIRMKSQDRLISEQCSKSFEDSEYDRSFPSNKSTCSSGFISTMSNCSFTDDDQKILSIKLFYFIYNNKKDIEIIIGENKEIKDLIIFSLNLINEQLISEKKNIQLDNSNFNNYCIKLIKNEKKESLEELNDNNIPPIEMDICLSDCDLEKNFFLIWNGGEKNNILPYKREDNRREKNNEIELILNKNKIKENNTNICYFTKIKKRERDNKSVKHNRNNNKIGIDIENGNCCLYQETINIKQIKDKLNEIYLFILLINLIIIIIDFVNDNYI